MQSYNLSKEQDSHMLKTSSVLLHGIKCVILLNLFTTTKILSLPSLVSGKPRTKSIDMSVQGSLGTFKGVYNPLGCDLDLASLHIKH